MRKLALVVAAAATLGAAGLLPSAADAAGCYRLGLGGYHWYRSCVGPHFLYPHRRVCHHGHCSYR